MILFVDEDRYAISSDDQSECGEPVAYGEIATLTMEDGTQCIACIMDPDDEDSFRVYKSSDFPNFSETGHTVQEAQFGDEDEDGDDDDEETDPPTLR